MSTPRLRDIKVSSSSKYSQDAHPSPPNLELRLCGEHRVEAIRSVLSALKQEFSDQRERSEEILQRICSGKNPRNLLGVWSPRFRKKFHESRVFMLFSAMFPTPGTLPGVQETHRGCLC